MDSEQSQPKKANRGGFKKGQVHVGVKFQKGTSGNPAGRPPSFATLVKQLRAGHIPARIANDPVKRRMYQEILQQEDPAMVAVRNLLIASHKGEPWAVRTVLEFGMEKPVTKIENVGDCPQNVTVIVERIKPEGE